MQVHILNFHQINPFVIGQQGVTMLGNTILPHVFSKHRFFVIDQFIGEEK